LFFSDSKDLNIWRPKITSLKEILGKLGLDDIRFALRQKKNGNKNSLPDPLKRKNSFLQKKTLLKEKENDFSPPLQLQ
jgi:hypothetical protein